MTTHRVSCSCFTQDGIPGGGVSFFFQRYWRHRAQARHRLAAYCNDYLLTIGRVIYQCTEFGFTFSESRYHETNVVSLALVVN